MGFYVLGEIAGGISDAGEWEQKKRGRKNFCISNFGSMAVWSCLFCAYKLKFHLLRNLIFGECALEFWQRKFFGGKVVRGDFQRCLVQDILGVWNVFACYL